jgi:hypothetical protein
MDAAGQNHQMMLAAKDTRKRKQPPAAWTSSMAGAIDELAAVQRHGCQVAPMSRSIIDWS